MTLARLAALAPLVALLLCVPAGAVTRVVSFDDVPPDAIVSEQYRTTHGVFFQGPQLGDGWFPVARHAGAIARSGTQVGDVSDCFSQAPNCEGHTPRSVGRLTTSARTVSAYAGFLGTGGQSSQVTLTALDAEDQPIAASSATVTQGQPFGSLVSVTSPSPTADIAAFELRGDQGMAGIAVDDLSVTTPDMPPPPDISVRVGSSPANVRQGSFVDVPVDVNRLNGSNGDVALGASGLPPGMTASFSPNPVPGTQTRTTLRLTAGRDAPPAAGYSEITIRATPAAGAGGASRTAKLLVRVVENCERTVRLDFIDARTSRCMLEAGPDRVVAANQTLRLNGLALTPEDGAGSLVIDKRARTVSSEGADVSVTPADHPNLRLYKGPVDWSLAAGSDGPRQVIDSRSSLIIGSGEEPIVDIFFGFRVDRIAVSLTKSGKAEVRPTLKLGFWPFNHFGATSATTGFSTDNDAGSNFDGLKIKLDRVSALGVDLKDVSVGYESGGRWSGGATLVVRFSKPYEVAAAFGLNDGALDFLRGSVGGLNIAVSAGVFLQRLGFEVKRNPLSLEGNARFSAGPSVRGAQFVVVDGAIKAAFGDPFVMQLTGAASLLNRFALANVFMRYSSDGLFELGGDLDWDLKVAYAKGRVHGFVDRLQAASLEGSVRGCIRIPWAPDPCAGGAILASNIGVAACVEIAYASAGIGYFWGDEFDLWWGSCDLGRWRPIPGAARAAAASRFKLPRGLPSAAFAVEGEGAAPGVTLRGPGGRRISVSNARPRARSGPLFAIQAGNGTTYVTVRRPAAGIWTLVHDGAVRRVRHARGLPGPKARVEVAGRGRKRTLGWRLRAIPGQRVRFAEVGRGVRRTIATTTRRSGRVRFRPADGPAGKRRIVALVEQNRLPRATIDAGSYRAPGRPRPTKPTRVRVTRRGTSLLVRWRAPRRGFRHAVHVAIGDGRRVVRIAPPRARALRLRGVGRGYGARVTVRGLTHANGRGPAARGRAAGEAPRPSAGRWRLSSAFGDVTGGGLRVARDRRTVSAISVVPGAGAAACGTSRLRVGGRLRLSRTERGGEALWIVGRAAPRTYDGARPARVSVSQAGKSFAGRLKLLFDSRRRGTGELEAGGCRYVVELRR